MTAAFLRDLEARGLVHQISSPDLAKALDAGPVTGYIGFDPSAASLHVGSMLQIVTLLRLQRAGHRPIALIGGGTGLIGDPSFKEAERKLLDLETHAVNVAGIGAQLERYCGDGAIVVNNADWLCKLELVPFLRDIGKHFSVNQMIARDSVRTRLETREQGISFTEFSYMLLQAFDFLQLYDDHGCTLQMGGSDQWGNIVSGADLVRRLRGGAETFALTIPLITRADGQKFGKSEDGNVWLDPELTSPYVFHQFWLNQDDADACRYLRYYSFIPVDEIAEIERAHLATPADRLAQRRLADEVTTLVHGQEATARARHTAQVLFGGDWHELSAQELQEAFAASPSSEIPGASLGGEDAGLVRVLADAGVCPSRGRARKDVEAGAVRVNDVQEKDVERVLAPDDVLDGGFIVVRKGKRTYHVLRVT